MQQFRDYIFLYLNGQPRKLKGAQAFLTVTEYLRQEQLLTGTKVVCAEGDCGACTVLLGAVKPGMPISKLQFLPVNACIQFMHGLDGCHLITIEGITPDDGSLHPVQQAMVEAQATQCGFCTPGFVMAAAGMMEGNGGQPASNAQQAKNHLTGNLCRCTGYQSIIEAMLHINPKDFNSVHEKWHHADVHQDLLHQLEIPVDVRHDKHRFQAPATFNQAAHQVKNSGHRLFAAATDLGVQHNKGHWQDQQVISLHLIPEAHQITIHPEQIIIGARVTLTTLEQQLENSFPEWADFMHVFASPQIKNNGTLIGNIANGSPIGDNLPFLLAMDALIHIQGPDRQRQMSINDFYLGYRQNDLQDDELISHVTINHKPANSFMRLYKASQRRDLDISCVAAAFYLVFDDQQYINSAAVALGGVAATALRLPAIEQLLVSQHRDALFDSEHQQQLISILNEHIQPLTDVRGSASFRRQLAANFYRRFVAELATSVGVADGL